LQCSRPQAASGDDPLKASPGLAALLRLRGRKPCPGDELDHRRQMRRRAQPMETTVQTYLISRKAIFLLPLLLLSAAAASPADANWFHNRSVATAPSPTPKDLRAISGESDYPALSQLQNEQGKVRLKIRLSEQGMMTDAVVERSSGFPRLDEAAVRYMKTSWRYQPPGKDKPMPETMQAEVTFKLQ
jgi:TonB family protein